MGAGEEKCICPLDAESGTLPAGQGHPCQVQHLFTSRVVLI